MLQRINSRCRLLVYVSYVCWSLLIGAAQIKPKLIICDCLNQSEGLRQTMTGQELHQLLLNKWGRSYDVQLRRTQGKIFVQVMWRYLEQASFPMSEPEYFQHLEAIAHYLQGWGGDSQVKDYVQTTRERPRLGKAVSIPLELGERASEWMLEEF
jgi:hypothetical protein